MMGGETEREVSPWTVDSLKELIDSQITLLITANDDRLELIQQHFEARIDNFEKRLMERASSQQEAIAQVRRETERSMADADKAILKSEAAAEKRFESVNEFRAQLADQAQNFMPREVGETQFSALDARLKNAESQLIEARASKAGATELKGNQRMDVAQMVAIVGTIIATVSTAVAIIIATR